MPPQTFLFTCGKEPNLGASFNKSCIIYIREEIRSCLEVKYMKWASIKGETRQFVRRTIRDNLSSTSKNSREFMKTLCLYKNIKQPECVGQAKVYFNVLIPIYLPIHIQHIMCILFHHWICWNILYSLEANKRENYVYKV